MQIQSNNLNFYSPVVAVVGGLQAPTHYEYALAKIYISKINTMTFLMKCAPRHAMRCESTWNAP